LFLADPFGTKTESQDVETLGENVLEAHIVEVKAKT
jgi:hypothetical protein